MEKMMTVEDKIRRAEEIYERRKRGNSENVANASVNEKRDIKLLKKMIIQIILCVAIYGVVYMVQNSNYIFSKDFINNVNSILSYDVNFIELYENIKNQIKNGFNFNKEQNNQENIGGAEKSTDKVNENNETNENNAVQEENTQNISQSEQDVINVKDTATFIKPIDGEISSKYGQRDTATGSVPKNHTGTDIAAATGTIIKASTDGEVVIASEEGDYGKHLKIQIGEVSIIYAHCNKLNVNQGDKVTQGQEIAEVGSTGNSTGPHLHFEIRISERTVDPERILEL